MTPVAKRKLDQTWRDAVADRARTAAPAEAGPCLAAFDRLVREGAGDAAAAHGALASFGLLWDVEAPDLSSPSPPGGPADPATGS